jgi:hypothetical protein
MSTGYEILSRTQSKLYNLTDETVLLTAGCMTDIIQLRKVPFPVSLSMQTCPV